MDDEVKTEAEAKAMVKAEDEVKKLLKKIAIKCKGGDYIFRGTDVVYADKKHDDKDIDIVRSTSHVDNEGLLDSSKNNELHDIEKDIVERVKSNVPDYRESTEIEVLTSLRHYGHGLLLIDFSLDMYIALFFACKSELGQNGELIMLEMTKFKNIDNDKYKSLVDDINSKSLDPKIIKPTINEFTKNRVLSQKSIFVYAPSGYIEISKDEAITIQSKIKEDILTYLEKYHGISSETIYSDLVGFIDNERKNRLSRIKAKEGDLEVEQKL